MVRQRSQTHYTVTPAVGGAITVYFNQVSGNCYTFIYGGSNGNANDTGVVVTSYSNTYRLNGNEVYMYAYTSVSGVHAGLVLANIKTYYYRNNAPVNTYSAASTTYGAQ